MQAPVYLPAPPRLHAGPPAARPRPVPGTASATRYYTGPAETRPRESPIGAQHTLAPWGSRNATPGGPTDRPSPTLPLHTHGVRPRSRADARQWAWTDSNGRPHPYQGCALTN